MTALSWQYGDLRIALAVDSFLYFATLRSENSWCFMSDDFCESMAISDARGVSGTVCFRLPVADDACFDGSEFRRTEDSIVFWNQKISSVFTRFRAYFHYFQQSFSFAMIHALNLLQNNLSTYLESFGFLLSVTAVVAIAYAFLYKPHPQFD